MQNDKFARRDWCEVAGFKTRADHDDADPIQTDNVASHHFPARRVTMAGTASPMSGSFVERHGLWDAEAIAAAEQVRAVVREQGLESIRFAFADQHGILRGKTVAAAALDEFLFGGCGMSATLLMKDTSCRTVFPVWSEVGAGLPGFNGAGDMMMVADPATFRVLPWARKTGWLLCDLYFVDGGAIPYSPRQIARQAAQRLAAAGYDHVAGLEIEFHVFRLVDAATALADVGQPGNPPQVSHASRGYQYLAEEQYDRLEPVMSVVHDACLALGLPLRTMEAEFGPSQVELTFDPQPALQLADNTVLLRSAIRQVCRRHGYHATFMTRPALPNVASSGWHLHQSLRARDGGANLFVPDAGGQPLSQVGSAFAAGLLEHAVAACLLTTPTINGYKRYRPFSLAPDRVLWGRDNRAAMLRVISSPGSAASRIENRVGEPAANPYLYVASQMLCGLDGIARGLVPPPPCEAPYASDAVRLPASMAAALGAFEASGFLRDALGADVANWFAAIKRAELERFLSEVTDWEQREYFDLF
ncbi:MAG TPA: glutamine synthetase family protein [Sphingobium sp.]|uniref:glutamine synthetase family protein n=1 Tax=Sphingobium sp. TaxID=1912891 RepID=UPI002ED14392